MPDPGRLRDSTEINLPCGVLEDVEATLEAEFTVTVVSRGQGCRIIGSPVEIKRVGQFLARQGVPIR
jgi:hypothetical protein